ncbi:thymidine kinase 2, mitochondrial-like isoform X2 [Mizuhopecten yessoensis]|uniref:thymidine kinase 2, mitochondrial-like isoform X2 n=1 Tax=Mizuhopecten yessoensis TaxID=6573 RepID=UPI000B4579D7|nr:thymidine kinase 2, mitochondrial-like isoform X2 [Mizuhopecten yessoensis]
MTSQHGLRISTFTREAMSVRLATKGSPAASFSSKPGKAFNVCVEGNIASGKTTFIQHLEKIGDIDFIEEQGKQSNLLEGHVMLGSELLGKIYEDPARWSFTLQNYIQLTMLEQHIRVSQKPVKVLERSINSAQLCFMEMFYRSGKMTDMEYVILSKWFDWIRKAKWFDWIRKAHNLNIGLTVYLRTTPENSYERIKSRNRPEEAKVTLDCLRTVHELHEDWLIRRNAGFPTESHVMVINADQPTEEMVRVFLSILNIINDTIYKS